MIAWVLFEQKRISRNNDVVLRQVVDETSKILLAVHKELMTQLMPLFINAIRHINLRGRQRPHVYL